MKNLIFTTVKNGNGILLLSETVVISLQIPIAQLDGLLFEEVNKLRSGVYRVTIEEVEDESVQS